MVGYFMGIHRHLHIRKVLVSTIPKSEFSRVNLNYNIDQIVTYINDDKSWKRCYVLLKMMFTCIRVIHLEDINKSGIDKVYYCSITAKLYIHKSCSDLDKKYIFTLYNSSNNKWDIFNDDDSDEDCFENNVTYISELNSSESMSSLFCHYCKNREEYINIDYAVTVWMLCVILHIHEYVLFNTNVEHMKQVNIFIKTLSHRIYDGEMNDTIYKFWSEYNAFNNKNLPFDGDDFIWMRKYILQGNSHVWHHNYSLQCKKVLGFVACRVTSKNIGIGAVEHYWGDVKTIKSIKRSAIRSDVSEKQSIFYTYACIASGRITQIESDHNVDENYPRHVFDDDDEIKALDFASQSASTMTAICSRTPTL